MMTNDKPVPQQDSPEFRQWFYDNFVTSQEIDEGVYDWVDLADRDEEYPNFVKYWKAK